MFVIVSSNVHLRHQLFRKNGNLANLLWQYCCNRQNQLPTDNVAHSKFSTSSRLSAPVASTNDLQITIENGVKKIVMNRPKVKNSLSYEMLSNLGNACYESNDENEVKLITLSGSGDSFCSGNDLKNWDTANLTISEIKDNLRKHVRQWMIGMIECRKPIIALVNGGAVGGGATMLPICDHVWASDKAFFYTPFVTLGIVPEFCSSYTFPKVMGYAKANDMLLFGHQMSAQEALECGFVSKVFPVDSFSENCQKLIDNYAKLPLEPLVRGKEMIRGQERNKLRQLAAYEMDHVLEESNNPHLKALLEKFFAKKTK